MGRGNVCVTGEFEGLYYINNDDFHAYRQSSDDETYTLLRDLSYEDIQGENWCFDEEETENELQSIIESFITDFIEQFHSFKRAADDHWLSNERRIILENNLFYVCTEDNEWSLAVELVQKEDPYDDHLKGLQKRHYETYLTGIKQSLLKLLPSIGIRCGAWCSGTITKEDL